MKYIKNQKGFSLIEAVVSMSVLGVGIVAVFTIFNSVVMLHQASQNTIRQSLEVNSIVEELRVAVPPGTNAEQIEKQMAPVLEKHQNWRVKAKQLPDWPGLYALTLLYQSESGKQRVFHAKIYCPSN